MINTRWSASGPDPGGFHRAWEIEWPGALGSFLPGLAGWMKSTNPSARHVLAFGEWVLQAKYVNRLGTDRAIMDGSFLSGG